MCAKTALALTASKTAGPVTSYHLMLLLTILVRLCRGSCMTCTIRTTRQIPAAAHRPFPLLFSILQAPGLVSALHSINPRSATQECQILNAQAACEKPC